MLNVLINIQRMKQQKEEWKIYLLDIISDTFIKYVV